MFKRILVPTDGSELAAQALPVAVDLGRPAHATIHLLRSTVGMGLPMPANPAYAAHLGPFDWLPDEHVLAEIDLEAHAALDDLIAAYRTPDIRWCKVVVDDDPAAAIVDYCCDEQIDLVVMSSHGHSGLERWALGSVTERVLRDAPCPVLVVRDVAPIRRMLIPLDDSPLAEAVMPPVLEVARLMEARATLLRVDQRRRPRELDMRLLDQVETGLSDALRSAAQSERYLHGVRARFSRSGAPVETDVVEGQPAPAILDYAARHDIDLIAMATHGRSGLRRWIYGSVTEKVLRASRCSLLVVRPRWEEENVDSDEEI